MSKIMVLGAGGYIGIPLVKELLENDYEVVCLDRFFFGENLLLNEISQFKDKFKLIKKDIRSLSKGYFDKIDIVFDLAGLSNDPSCDLDPKLTKSINSNSVEMNVKLAKDSGVERYIYFSSCSIYGSGENSKVDENSSFNPVSEYAKAKINAENYVLRENSKKFTTTCMRNSTVFGLAPRMRFDLVVNIMTKIALQEKRLYILGGGNQWRPLIHVKDLVDAAMIFLRAPKEKISGQAFNVGGNHLNYKVSEIAKKISDTMTDNIELIKVPDDDDKRSYRVEFKKIKNNLNFVPNISIEDGVNEICEALKKNKINPDDIRWNTLQYYQKIIKDIESF